MSSGASRQSEWLMTICGCTSGSSVRICGRVPTSNRSKAARQLPNQSRQGAHDLQAHAATHATRAGRGCSAVEMVSSAYADGAREVSIWRPATPRRRSCCLPATWPPPNGANSRGGSSRGRRCTRRDAQGNPSLQPRLQPERRAANANDKQLSGKLSERPGRHIWQHTL